MIIKSLFHFITFFQIESEARMNRRPPGEPRIHLEFSSQVSLQFSNNKTTFSWSACNLCLFEFDLFCSICSRSWSQLRTTVWFTTIGSSADDRSKTDSIKFIIKLTGKYCVCMYVYVCICVCMYVYVCV